MEKNNNEKIGLQISVYKLDFELKINFIFQNSYVHTITQKKYEKLFPNEHEVDLPDDRIVFGTYIPKMEKVESEFGFLIIETTSNLNNYDSLNQGAASIRPDIIVIHGIISFLSNEVFMPSDSFTNRAFKVEYNISDYKEKIQARINGKNLTPDLIKILDTIENANKEQKTLFFTILERWRKALFLEKESEESDIFIDESVLAYMHVLEVIGDEFKYKLEKANDDLKSQICSEITNYIQSQNVKENEIVKLINKLDNTRISLKAKLFQLLIEFNLDNSKSQNIVERFIEHRNAIAHGRKNLYQEKLVFPLPQFFSFIKDIEEDTEIMKILAARCISKLFNLDLWKDEWEEKLMFAVIPLKEVNEFIKGNKYNQISKVEFLLGLTDEVTPYALTYYYKRKKLKFRTLETVLKNSILSFNQDKVEGIILFESAAILADSLEKKVAEKCKEIIKLVYQNTWIHNSEIRDLMKIYEYFGIKLIWFGEWLKVKNEN